MKTARQLRNYIIEEVETGRVMATGLAESKRDARQITGYTSRRYIVIEAHAPGMTYARICR